MIQFVSYTVSLQFHIIPCIHCVVGSCSNLRACLIWINHIRPFFYSTAFPSPHSLWRRPNLKPQNVRSWSLEIPMSHQPKGLSVWHLRALWTLQELRSPLLQQNHGKLAGSQSFLSMSMPYRVSQGPSMCIYVYTMNPWHTCLSVVNCEKCPLSSQKCLAVGTKKPSVLFCFWASISALMFNATAAWCRSHRTSNSKCWNSRNLRSNEMLHTVYSPYDQRTDHGTGISYRTLSYLQKDKELHWLSSSAQSTSPPHTTGGIVPVHVEPPARHCHEEIKANRICTNESTQHVYILYSCIDTLSISGITVHSWPHWTSYIHNIITT